MSVTLALGRPAASHAGVLDLAWDAPTTNSDSSGLTDLSGYRIYSSTTSLTSCPPSSTPVFVPSPTSTPTSGTVINHQLTGLTQGTTYHVRVTAVDQSGNESACSNEITSVALADPDSTPPTVSITSPAASSTVSGTVTVTASATDNVGIASVEFRLDGAVQSTDTTAPYSWSWNTTGTSNASHTLTAVATDTAGNSTTSGNVLVNVNNVAPDTTPPTATLAAPANGATVNGTVTVTATATDNVGVTSVAFYLDGALQRTDTSSPYTWSWTTTGTSNGSHTLTAVASDAAGNTTTSTAVSVTVSNAVADTTPPTVTLTAPANGATVSGTTTVTATASDNVGVASVAFYLNGTLQNTDTSSPYSWSWSTNSGSNGSFNLTAVAADAAGNSTTSAAVTVTVSNSAADTTAPTVSLTSPANGATISGTITVTATASDNVGVANVKFYLDGSLQQTDATAPYTWSWTTNGAANGPHTVSAIAADQAGNNSTTSAVSVTVSNAASDTTPPTVSLTSPPGGSSVSGTISVTASASDNIGVTSVQFYLDGVLQSIDTTNTYSWSWDTSSTAGGGHMLTAVATDAAGNTTTSAAVPVTVSNLTSTAASQSLAPASSGSQSGLRCFIATAAYGSPLEPEVVVLRTFRDRMLLTNEPGRAFVETYYRLSPPLARLIASTDSLRMVTRHALRPLIWWSELALDSPGLAWLLFGSGAFGPVLAVGMACYRRRTHRRRRCGTGKGVS